MDVPARKPAAERDQRPVVLVVDGHPFVAERLAEDLRGRFSGDYRVETTTSAQTALDLVERLAAAGDELAIAMADAALPDVPGLELLARVHAVYPHAKRVLLVERNYRATSPSVARDGARPDRLPPDQAVGARGDALPGGERDPRRLGERPARGGSRWFSVVGERGGASVPSFVRRSALSASRSASFDVASDAGRAAPGPDRQRRQPAAGRRRLRRPRAGRSLEGRDHGGVRRPTRASTSSPATSPSSAPGPPASRPRSTRRRKGSRRSCSRASTSGGQAGASSADPQLSRASPARVSAARHPHAYRACEQAWLFGANLVFANEARGIARADGERRRVVELANGREVRARAPRARDRGSLAAAPASERLEALVGAGVFYGAAANEGHAAGGRARLRRRRRQLGRAGGRPSGALRRDA